MSNAPAIARETIIDNEAATLYHYPENKIVHHVFHKFIYGEDFRQVLTAGVELFRKHGAYKWLSDDRLNSAIPTEDVEWSMQQWAPQALAAGWKHWAVVMPDKIAGQLNMNRFFKRYIETGLNIQVFTTPEEALEWLMSV